MKYLFLILPILSVFLTGSTELPSDAAIASSDTPFSYRDFIILIEADHQNIKLTNVAGSAWNTLTFNLDPTDSVAINQYGMARELRTETPDPGLADFHIVVRKDKDGVHLRGLRGTNFLELSFNSSDHKIQQLVDANGMRTE